MEEYSFSLSRALTFCFIIIIISSSPLAASGEKTKSGDRKTVGEAMAEAKLELESHVNRRMLAYTGPHISYEALNRDGVPCSRRGDSYKNCQPEAQENPYSRGCSVLTRCRPS